MELKVENLKKLLQAMDILSDEGTILILHKKMR